MKPLTDFHTRNGKPYSMCKTCHREYGKRHYDANKQYYIDKAKKRNASILEANRNYVYQYLLSHPCVICGETDIVVLQFDHLGDKISTISEIMRKGWSLETLKLEIDKCQVLCANDHLRKTAKDFNWWKTVP